MQNIVHFQWNLSPRVPFNLDVQTFDQPNFYPVLDLHQSLHLILILKGSLNGKIDTLTFSAQAGQLLVTAPWELHGNNRMTTDTRILSITVDPTMLLGNLIAYQEKAWSLLMMPPSERMSALDTTAVHQLVKHWGEALQQPRTGTPELIRMRLWLAIQTFFAELLGILAEQQLPDTPGENYQRLLPAFQLLSQQPTVTVPQAAQACSLSVSRFSHLFQTTCRTSFAAYELRTRLNRAAMALKQGQMVKTVARQHGFFDASHFAKHFLRQFGMRPGQWAQKSTDAPPLA